MFCKHCGTKIDDDSVFCNKCGMKQNSEKNQKEQNKKTKDGDNTKYGCLLTYAIIVVILAITFLSVVLLPEACDNKRNDKNFTENESNEPQIFTRNARNNDVTITAETNYSNLGVDIIILPKVDIEDLKIKLVHLDKNGKELLTQYKTIGNVKEGVQVKTQVQLLDFSITDMFKVYNTKIEVIEGTVSYFD